MKITIHQPEHLPYFGFLDKINKADTYVVLDDVQYTKSNVQNRNRILTKNGVKWLTVPINRKGWFKPIQEQRIPGDWKLKYRNLIISAYKEYDYFDEGISIIDNMLDISSNKLIDYNMFYIKTMIKLLSINTRVIFSSNLNIQSTGSQRIKDICDTLSAKTYISGPNSRNYLSNVDLEIANHQSTFIPYNQKNSNQFVPALSSLDIIMSTGISNLSIMLRNSNTI